MVVALFALSLVMVVGGIAAVIQGFPYVRLESGLAMVIGGATAASAGTILLGLSAVVVRLKRIEEALGDASLRTEAARPSDFAPLPDFGMTPPVAPPRLAGDEPAPGGLEGLGLGATGLGAGLRGSEPSFEQTTPVVAANAPSEPPVEPLLPDLLPPDEAPVSTSARPDPEPVTEASAVQPEQDLFARPAADEDDVFALRPSLKDGPSDVDDPAGPPAPEAEAHETSQEGHREEPQVVGTYASGGNTYVMYSTGMIEADTPNGRFTFNSLDELKAFVDSGGENQARGAA